MPKKSNKTIWVCKECGGEHLNWSGKCSYCGAWNSLSEVKSEIPGIYKETNKVKPVYLNEIKLDVKDRLKSGLTEFDLALGGGIVKGSVILLGGHPGIGKSTLIWQIANKIPGEVCYLAAEESASQIKLRAQRLGSTSKKISIFEQRNIDSVLMSLQDLKPSLLIVDSIQTIFDPALNQTSGSLLQVRSCTLKLIDFAKSNQVAVILIGHVTKEGEVAGPKTLEHLVDAVFYLEGSSSGEERFLRASKNRFGSTEEIGVFEMTSEGLQPSTSFGRMKPSSLLPEGVSRSAVIEGSRVIFLEIQALVQKSNSPLSRRNAVGYDLNRLHMMCAIISKVCKIDLSNFDVFLNISEGYRLRSTMADAAIAMAIISSYRNLRLSGQSLFIGELDLSGALHLASESKKIIKTAEKAGFVTQYKNYDLSSLAKKFLP